MCAYVCLSGYVSVCARTCSTRPGAHVCVGLCVPWALWVCQTLQTDTTNILTSSASRQIRQRYFFRFTNSLVKLTLGLTPQGPRGPPGGWKVKSSAYLDRVRMLATSPSTSTTSPTCEIHPNLMPFLPTVHMEEI